MSPLYITSNVHFFKDNQPLTSLSHAVEFEAGQSASNFFPCPTKTHIAPRISLGWKWLPFAMALGALMPVGLAGCGSCRSTPSKSQPSDEIPNQLDDQYTIGLGEAMISALKEEGVEVVFVGEAHDSNEEQAFIPLMKMLKENGVEYLAIEEDSGKQEAMDRLLNSKEAVDTSGFSRSDIRRFNNRKLIPFYQAAAQAGIQVVCVGVSRQRSQSYTDREQGMAENIMALRGHGKIIVWIGSVHAHLEKDSSYPSVRTFLENFGIKTKGIKLESSGREIQEHEDIFKAFYTYFPHNYPAESFAYPTTQLGALKYFYFDADPRSKEIKRINERWLLYREGYNYVFFLSEKDSEKVIY